MKSVSSMPCSASPNVVSRSVALLIEATPGSRDLETYAVITVDEVQALTDVTAHAGEDAVRMLAPVVGGN